MRTRIPQLVGLAALAAATSACSLITVEQDPFPPLQIQAKRPAPPPARVVLTDSAITFVDKIQFELGKAILLPASDGLLGEIAQVMKDNPQLEVVQIEGYTSSEGGADVNRKLSQARAESVKAWMIKHGIAASRLVAKGFGPDKPVADNATPEGKEKNRRVEFNIVKQGKKKTLVQDE